MPKSSTPKPTPPKSLRSDGADAHSRLLDAALTLFADKGFAKTSIRDIAQAAQVNIASISYYFGDKAGLYRAVFTDPRSKQHIIPHPGPDVPMALQASLDLMLQRFIGPLKQDQLIQQCMKLHFREMLEPTGVWKEEVETNIKPAHHALVAALCQHLGVAEPDDDIHRLAFSISGLGVMLHIGHDIITTIRPQLLATHAALDLYSERLMGYAVAMADAEGARRAAANAANTKAPKDPKAAKPTRQPTASATTRSKRKTPT